MLPAQGIRQPGTNTWSWRRIDNTSLPVVAMHESAMDEKINILLVDDQPANLLVLEAILTDFGQNRLSALSGAEALQRLEEYDFAVILLDVQMHGLNGFDTAQQIRARDPVRHTPIIFITAYDSDEFPVERAYLLGAV